MAKIDNLISDLDKYDLTVKNGLHYGAHLTLNSSDPEPSHSKALLHFHTGGLPIKSLIRWNRVATANNKSTIIALEDGEDFIYMSLERINNRNQ